MGKSPGPKVGESWKFVTKYCCKQQPFSYSVTVPKDLIIILLLDLGAQGSTRLSTDARRRSAPCVCSVRGRGWRP